MKRISEKQRDLDVKRSLINRKKIHSRTGTSSNSDTAKSNNDWRLVNGWIEDRILDGFNFEKSKKKKLVITLPKRMDFSDNYETTIVYITAIRKLARRGHLPRKALILGSVNFQYLSSISTSAALVLTAELSRWQDTLGKKLIPQTHTWNPNIFSQLNALGFFDLFESPPIEPPESKQSNLKLVRYIKGKAKEKSKTRQLRESLKLVIGDDISQWTFLRGGLDEAITNVSHHAYPENICVNDKDQNWYLTGSYDPINNRLKIAFYDQGIGIPRSLPASEIWEKVLNLTSKISKDERRLHKTLLKAAVQIDRTSTLETDRGKGLQDLLTFIDQRGEGYLSILSLKGLYKYTMLDGTSRDKSFSFNNELPGTLIIWSVSLIN